LKNTFTLTGNYDDDGNFEDFSTELKRVTGSSFGLVPGTDGVEQQPNQDGYIKQLSDGSYVGGFEQHTELNKFISAGLQALHGRKVDVAQDLRITIDRDGKLKATLMHGTFPSVSATMNGKSVYQFAHHSFLLSHSKTTDPSDIRFSIKNVIEGKMFQEVSDKINLINRSKQAPYLYFGGFNSAPVNPKKYSAISWNY
jgi:hypothetical protein